MQIFSYTRARQSFAELMRTANSDHTPIHVTQKSGDDVVIVSKKDFDAMQEMLHLMSSPTNAKRLNDSITELESGEGAVHALADA